MGNFGFKPIVDENSKILILGSFPSVKSREVGFYYGNPQNRFWKALSFALKKQIPNDTDGKIKFLLENNIALYDMYSYSNIKGSSDSDINKDNSITADILSVIKIPKDLKLIICNGKKSYTAFNETVKDITAKVIYLSSTSSANPKFNILEWERAINSI